MDETSKQAKRHQQWLLLGVCGSGLLLLGGLALALVGEKEAAAPHVSATKTMPTTTLMAATDSVDDRVLWVKKIQQENDQVRAEAELIKEQNKILEQRVDVLDTLFKQQQLARKTVVQSPLAQDGGPAEKSGGNIVVPTGLPVAAPLQPSAPSLSSEAIPLQRDTFPASSSGGDPAQTDAEPVAPVKKILHVGVAGRSSGALKRVDTYLPAGSYARCVLLSGVVASTATNAPSQPQPIVMRLMDDGQLPRGFRSCVKDAVVIGACYGDISSERVMCRLETMSWVEKDGTTVERPVEGWVMGEDGRPGLRGQVVDRSTEVARESIVAGVLSSMGNFFQMQTQRSVYPVSPFGQTNALSAGDALQGAGAGGVGKALDRLADFSIKRAEQMQPVILVASGRVVDIVFKSGVDLLPFSTPPAQRQKAEEGS